MSYEVREILYGLGAAVAGALVLGWAVHADNSPVAFLAGLVLGAGIVSVLFATEVIG